MKKIVLLSLFLFIFTSAHSQLGVTKYDESVEDYYTLFSNSFGSNSYLIDNCGRLINSWTPELNNGLSSELLPDGRLLRAIKSQGSNIWQPSIGGAFEILSWDGETQEWFYQEAGEDYVQHHDFSVLPNGNIIFLGWEAIQKDVLIEMGLIPDSSFVQKIWFEYIKEIKPVGTDTELIWEWHMLDHLVQDYNTELENFGVIADNPHKFNINYRSPLRFGDEDPFHANAIDYDPIRDEILINVRSIGEFWILDHSTTTEEAASSSGGNAGQGGDLLFRWGNPAAYDRQIVAEDWRLFGAHGTNFINPGLPNEGKIIVFNNGDLRPDGSYSTVDRITPSLNDLGQYYLNSDGQFSFDEHQILYGADKNLLSTYEANAHQLPNGNIFINETDESRLLEIDENQEILWEYKIPLYSNIPLNQSDSSNLFLCFVSHRYPTNFEGFDNVDLSPGEPIELNSTSDFCNLLPVINIANQEISIIRRGNQLNISENVAQFQMRIISINGREIDLSVSKQNEETVVDISNLVSGYYILNLWNNEQLVNFPFIVH